jgi:short subunit dehydrogenase
MVTKLPQQDRWKAATDSVRELTSFRRMTAETRKEVADAVGFSFENKALKILGFPAARSPSWIFFSRTGAGAHVLVHYGRSAQEAESVVATIQAKDGRANAISADLGTPNGAALLAGQVRSIVDDRLDVLVSNAGTSKAAAIADYTVQDFDNLFAINVRSPFFRIMVWPHDLTQLQPECHISPVTS